MHSLRSLAELPQSRYALQLFSNICVYNKSVKVAKRVLFSVSLRATKNQYLTFNFFQTGTETTSSTRFSKLFLNSSENFNIEQL